MSERAALLALLRLGHHWSACAELVESCGSARAALERELLQPSGQASLLADVDALVASARAELDGWERSGWSALTVVDRGYPTNLRHVHDRPPLIFVAGSLLPADSRATAVIGSRRASPRGLAAAAEIARALVADGQTVVSGLAAGVDTATHVAALGAGGRTIAVIGTGLAHCYPAQNGALQARIGSEGAVVSRFWPDDGPSRRSFPLRNAVMSGLARATVVVEASSTSGARVQARLALAHGRPVLLWAPLLAQDWAMELAERPGVHVVKDPAEVPSVVARLSAEDALMAGDATGAQDAPAGIAKGDQALRRDQAPQR
ncbi:MAG: DNA-processing protein DprA [Solirubrobacteraceae bacterium]